MSDSKFDLSKLKDNVGELMGNIKSMINPGGAIPTVDLDDALGIKIVKLATLMKQMVDAQQEQVKNLTQCNTLLNDTFQDIEALRNSIKEQKLAGSTDTPAEKPAASKKTKSEK